MQRMVDMGKHLLRKLRPSLAYNQVLGNITPGVVFLSGFQSNMNGQKAMALEEWCRPRLTIAIFGNVICHTVLNSPPVQDKIEVCCCIYHTAMTTKQQKFINSSMTNHKAHTYCLLHMKVLARTQGFIYAGGLTPAFERFRHAQLHIVQLKSQNRSFVRFDYRSTGASEGDAATFSDWVDDASDVFSSLTQGPQILIGSSMGACVMLHLHNRFPSRVVGLIGVAPGFYFVDRVRKWKTIATFEDGMYTYPSTYGDHQIPEVFFDEQRLDEVDLFKNNQRFNLHCPLTIFHGMADDTIPWQDSLKFMEESLDAKSNEVKVLFRNNGDHRLSTEADLKILANELSFMIANNVNNSSSQQSTL